MVLALTIGSFSGSVAIFRKEEVTDRSAMYSPLAPNATVMSPSVPTRRLVLYHGRSGMLGGECFSKLGERRSVRSAAYREECGGLLLRDAMCTAFDTFARRCDEYSSSRATASRR